MHKEACYASRISFCGGGTDRSRGGDGDYRRCGSLRVLRVGDRFIHREWVRGVRATRLAKFAGLFCVRGITFFVWYGVCGV